MSFLNWPTEEGTSTKRRRRARHRVIANLLEIYGRAFPAIEFELLWESPSLNAQAWYLGERRFVRVYGGLARHQSMTRAGLSLVLAHETGHHLGGEPRDPWMPRLTWQGQADFWAASVGMPVVWGARARGMTIRGAKEIAALHNSYINQTDCDEPDLSPECRTEIFRAGAMGDRLPSSAKEAFKRLSTL
jgi:hypothetical protein